MLDNRDRKLNGKTHLQVGLVPKNYLVELSQYLTSDDRGGGGPAANGSANNGSSAAGGGGGALSPAADAAQLSSRPWFYGLISRSDCDRLLAERGIDGDYLIRESETNVSVQSVFLMSSVQSSIAMCRL